MEMLILGTLTSVLGTAIYDVVKATLKTVSSSEILNTPTQKKIAARFEKYPDFVKILEIAPQIQNFVKSQMFTNTLQQYCLYKLNGQIPDEIRSSVTQNVIIDEDISLLFFNLYIVFLKGVLDDDTKSQLLNFFNEILQSTASILSESLSLEDQRNIILINKRIDSAARLLLDKIESLCTKPENGSTFAVRQKKNNYLQIKDKYNTSMKNLFSRSFIYLLDEYEFSQFYIPPVLLSARASRKSDILNSRAYSDTDLSESWQSIFSKRSTVYIVGKAGYGKSLLLRKIVNSFEELKIEEAHEYLVILCDLKQFYSKDYSSKKSIIDFLQESMISLTGFDEFEISKPFIEYFLKLGRCIVLFDALDEVAKESRPMLHKKIISFFNSYSRSNKICITSRDRGFIPLKTVDVLMIRSLTVPDISKYIDKMIALNKFKKTEKATFLKQSITLVRKHFLDNFLVLSLLVSIYKSERELPSTKIELYKKCFEYIYKKREKDKSEIYNWNRLSSIMKDSTFISLAILAAPYNRNIKKADIYDLLLEQYRKKFTNEVETEAAISEFLDFCSDRTELLVLADVDEEFKFFHRSFFEYFYARYLNQNTNPQQIYEALKAFDIDSEVFELVLALIKEENELKYQNLIETAIYAVTTSFEQNLSYNNALHILTLLMQVVDDSCYICRYFELIIMCFVNMNAERPLFELDELTARWLIKAIQIKAEFKQLFIDVFSKIVCCIFFISIHRLPSADVEIPVGYQNKYEFWQERFIPSMFFRAIMDTGYLNVPFFWQVSQRIGVLDTIIKKACIKDVTTFAVETSLFKKSVIKKIVDGYNRFSTLTTEDQNALITRMTNVHIADYFMMSTEDESQDQYMLIQ
ncbi:MAG: NACHT domain-containing protein [Clostridiaceae bacterium]